MSTRWKYIFVALSVGMNLAFIGLWVVHTMPVGHREVAGKEVWCSLHKQLGATPEQWQEIEPAMLSFQAKARETCGETGLLRLELIELLAAEKPDIKAIRVKQEQIQDKQRHMQELVVDHLLKTREALNAEQRTVLFNLLRRQAGCAGSGPMRLIGDIDREPNSARDGSINFQEDRK